MSASKIFQTLIGDQNIVLQNTDFQSDYIIFHGRIKDRSKKCSCCGSLDVVIKETKVRTFRTLNIEKKRTYLKIDVFKLQCNKCNKRAWMQLPEGLLSNFAGKGKSINNKMPGVPDYRERVDFHEFIGYYIDDLNPEVKLPTTKGTIRYSKKRAHIVPSHPNGN